MRIESIGVHNLRFEYPPERRFAYSGGRCTARVTSLILVHTDTGAVGVGSAYSHPGLVYLVVKEQLEPLLRGEDPTRVEALWDRMYGLTRWYGRKGAAMSALGGLDTAFWDLRGQAAGKPVWALLGGAAGRCPAYGSALLWKDRPGELTEEAGRLVERGFRRVKMRMGKGEDYDTAAVREVRRAVGPDIDVMADAGMRYHVELARRVGRVLDEERVFWFEEPFPPEDLESYARLRGTIRTPLAAGENEFGLQGFREMVKAGAVDIVQPDASRCGGITEVWRAAELARAGGLRVAPHTWSDAVAVTANAHAVAAMGVGGAGGGGLTVEVDATGNPFIESLLRAPLRIRDGMLDLGDAPGLGIALDMERVRALEMPDPLRVPPGTYSDMVFGKEHYTPADPYRESGA